MLVFYGVLSNTAKQYYYKYYDILCGALSHRLDLLKPGRATRRGPFYAPFCYAIL